MSIKKFMTIDLLVLSIVAIFSEIVGEMFGFMGMNRPILITLAYPVILASYVRWHKFGLLLNIVIIVTDLIMYQSLDFNILMVRSFSSVGLIMGFFYLAYLNKKNIAIKKDVYTSIIYYLISYTSLMSLQGLLQIVFVGRVDLVGLLIYHVANILLGLIVMIVMSIQPNFLINMRPYLNNFHKRDVE